MSTNNSGRVRRIIGEIADRLIVLEREMSTGGVPPAPPPQGYLGHADQAFGHVTYAQHGEDMLFVNYFHALGIARPTWLDIGAHHPINISNTALLYKRGGRGINIEANPNLIESFNKERPEDININIGIAPEGGHMTFYMVDKWSGRNTFDKHTAEEFVRQNPSFSITETMQINVLTINEVVERFCGGEYPDLLSIDVEGLDYDILRSADFSRSSPKIICVEVISGSGDMSGPMRELLGQRGYVIAAKTIGNTIFVRKELEVLYV
jgi:FkbM family methyltransferase